MSDPQSLNDKLADTLKSAYYKGKDNLGYSDFELSGDIDKLLTIIESLLDELIGKDQHFNKNDPMYEMSGEPFHWAERNELRTEQRSRATSLLKALKENQL